MNQKSSANIILIIIIIVLAGVAGYFALIKKSVPTPTPLPKDETADWETYTNGEIGIGFKYPSEWESPIVKERTIGECNYKEVYFSGKGGIHIRPKIASAFLCFQPGPYFECGNYYFECSPSLSSFNCQPYKDETGNYDSMKIWNDLKSQGFNCSISVGRPYAPFIYNPELLQKQFQILEKASRAVKLDKSLEEEIKSDFILFRPSFMIGSDNRFYVELIYNPQIDTQGIKIIGYDGSDISAANYYYQVVFLKDNKIISARLSLFYEELLKWAEGEMLQTKQGKSFNERIIEDLKNKNEESQIYKIVREYDLLAKSIYLP